MNDQPSETALEEAVELVMGEWFSTRSEIEARKDAPQRVARALEARDQRIAKLEAALQPFAAMNISTPGGLLSEIRVAREAMSDD